MMYNSKLVAAIKVNDKVLREFKEVVKLPFGSEYSIYLKNLNSVKALVSITVDGKDVLDGTQLVLHPGQEVDLKRSLNKNSNTHGNAFKFIERTDSIEKNRGVGVEDGLIRVEYQFEKVVAQVSGNDFNWIKKYEDTKKDDWWNKYTLCDAVAYKSVDTNTLSGTVATKGSTAFSSNSVVNCASTASTASVNEAGITVPGRIVEQQFHQVASFLLEPAKHVMVLHLLGEVAGQQVQEAVTVKSKPKCVTCGKQNKSTNKFCSDCGTSLTIV